MSTSRRVRWGALIAASVLAVGTIALIWFVAVPIGPLVCPAVYPMPTNCAAANREGSAVVATGIVVGSFIVTALATLWRTRVGATLTALGVTVLALAPVIAYASIAWSPGFPIR